MGVSRIRSGAQWGGNARGGFRRTTHTALSPRRGWRIYIYIYTRVFPCASAHGEASWNWSEVATMVSGCDPTVLSQELSHILSQTLSQLLSQLRSQRAEEEEEGGTIQEWTLSHFANVGTLPGLQQGLHGRACRRLRPRGRGCQRLRPRGQHEKQRLLEKSGYYPISRAVALSKSGNDRILRMLALSKSGNYCIWRALTRSKSGTYRSL